MEDVVSLSSASNHVRCQFITEKGENTGVPLALPIETTTRQLDVILNSILHPNLPSVDSYIYFIENIPLTVPLKTYLLEKQRHMLLAQLRAQGRRIPSHEQLERTLDLHIEYTLDILYRTQASFYVLPVTRCSSALAGHTKAVLVVSFSPENTLLATGGGDATVRLWDLLTETPTHTLTGHRSWVQVLSWSPNGRYLVSGSQEGTVFLWRPTGQGHNVQGHKAYISSASWEPLHKAAQPRRFVTGSKDSTLKIWNVNEVHVPYVELTLSGHKAGVTCARWGGGAT